ncbi:MAG: OmpH family outer membrane protein [Bacteroidales bacterium]|nr:OmpH family outer membrane protein [Bacteroidales bacterium]
MKKVVNILLVSAFLLACIPANSQDLKFGHINSQELLTAMPESDSAQATIESLAGDYELQLEEMNVELRKKYDDYLNNQDSYSSLIKQTKEADIQEMQQRIQQFEQMAQQDLQSQQQQLLQPILEKANNAIKEVAEENGFVYIFDVSRGNPVYFSDKSIDILPLVRTKLGL